MKRRKGFKLSINKHMVLTCIVEASLMHTALTTLLCKEVRGIPERKVHKGSMQTADQEDAFSNSQLRILVLIVVAHFLGIIDLNAKMATKS